MDSSTRLDESITLWPAKYSDQTCHATESAFLMAFKLHRSAQKGTQMFAGVRVKADSCFTEASCTQAADCLYRAAQEVSAAFEECSLHTGELRKLQLASRLDIKNAFATGDVDVLSGERCASARDIRFSPCSPFEIDIWITSDKPFTEIAVHSSVDRGVQCAADVFAWFDFPPLATLPDEFLTRVSKKLSPSTEKEFWFLYELLGGRVATPSFCDRYYREFNAPALAYIWSSLRTLPGSRVHWEYIDMWDEEFTPTPPTFREGRQQRSKSNIEIVGTSGLLHA